MKKTKIEWTTCTWNPTSGCTECSPGCAKCYARTIAERLRGTVAFPNGFEITLRPHKLSEPGTIREPSLVFVNSTSDVFHEEIPDTYRAQIFESIERWPQHRYQILTKRPAIAARYFSTRAVPASVWLGVSVEDRKRRDRIDVLRAIGAPVRFLSCEPLLEDLGELDLTGIHWVIVGGESGRHLAEPQFVETRALVRKMREKSRDAWQPKTDRAEWVRNIHRQCVQQNVAFFFKQWGGLRPTSAGRELDGRTWDEMPDHVPGAMPGDAGGSP